ncbi:hypothetical protein [Burkholderia pseudomallei]|uniref:hypothetical protein n=1 Tax=Burkholderia pseudomallei TaxID=28450 RepID=UPI000ACA39D0|nr:hypothetical protein [Burkholderia pseudomallei]
MTLHGRHPLLDPLVVERRKRLCLDGRSAEERIEYLDFGVRHGDTTQVRPNGVACSCDRFTLLDDLIRHDAGVQQLLQSGNVRVALFLGLKGQGKWLW